MTKNSVSLNEIAIMVVRITIAIVESFYNSCKSIDILDVSSLSAKLSKKELIFQRSHQIRIDLRNAAKTKLLR